jgi:exopolyphosphatase/guanosine-5'-triphosphate,3'-diphosphate pyrophosphatase
VKLAAIDIGSNAIRFQISNALLFRGEYAIKKIEYIRFPLRLGEDVFKEGRVGTEKLNKLERLFSAYAALLELYEVQDLLVYATSALREAQNGEEVVKEIKKATGIQIEIISGLREAEIINRVIEDKVGEGIWIHIDVGGGSTELTIYRNRKKLHAESFSIGSVRRKDGLDESDTWNGMALWLQRSLPKKPTIVHAIGTGGNINKIAELAGVKATIPLSIKKLSSTVLKLKRMSLEERIHIAMLNPDRADVLVPAAEIYQWVMERVGATLIQVPMLGLKDGMIKVLFDKHRDSIAPSEFR